MSKKNEKTKKLTPQKAKPKGKHPGGRPSLYSTEIAKKICHGIIEGKRLVDICEPEDMPGVSTMHDWRNEIKEFADMYARARELRAELDEDEIKAIARDGSNDYGFKEAKDESGESAKPVFLPENVQRSKLIVDTLKWSMSRRAPKTYGDKVDVELAGKDGKPIKTESVIKVTMEI